MLQGGVRQWVAILRKHDSGAGTRPGRRRVTGRLLVGPAETHAAEEAAEGAAHLRVSAGVDHCVDQRVGLRQEQEVLLYSQNVAGLTVQTVQEQHHLAWGPAHHKCPCRTKAGSGVSELGVGG